MKLSQAFWDEVGKLDPAAKKRRDENRPKFIPGRFSELWESVGLENVEETTIEIRMDFASFDNFWLPVL